jgi:hypothetical protein
MFELNIQYLLILMVEKEMLLEKVIRKKQRIEKKIYIYDISGKEFIY